MCSFGRLWGSSWGAREVKHTGAPTLGCGTAAYCASCLDQSWARPAGELEKHPLILSLASADSPRAGMCPGLLGAPKVTVLLSPWQPRGQTVLSALGGPLLRAVQQPTISVPVAAS